MRKLFLDVPLRLFPKIIQIPQNHVLGVLSPAELESDIKKCNEANLRVYTSFFVKFSTLTLNLGLMASIDMGNTNITIKNSYDILLRVYASIFRKNTNLSQYLEIGYVGVLRRQEY